MFSRPTKGEEKEEEEDEIELAGDDDLFEYALENENDEYCEVDEEDEVLMEDDEDDDDVEEGGHDTLGKSMPIDDEDEVGEEEDAEAEDDELDGELDDDDEAEEDDENDGVDEDDDDEEEEDDEDGGGEDEDEKAEDDTAEADFAEFGSVLEDGGDDEDVDQGTKRRGDHAFNATFRPIRILVPPKKKKKDKGPTLDPNVAVRHAEGMVNPDDSLQLFKEHMLPILLKPPAAQVPVQLKRSETKYQVLLTLRDLIASRGFIGIRWKRKADLAEVFQDFDQTIMVGVRKDRTSTERIVVFLAWSHPFNVGIAREMVKSVQTANISQIVIVTRAKATPQAKTAIQELDPSQHQVTWFREDELRRNVYLYHKMEPVYTKVDTDAELQMLLKQHKATPEKIKTLTDEAGLVRFHGFKIGDAIRVVPVPEHPYMEPTEELKFVIATTIQK